MASGGRVAQVLEQVVEILKAYVNQNNVNEIAKLLTELLLQRLLDEGEVKQYWPIIQRLYFANEETRKVLDLWEKAEVNPVNIWCKSQRFRSSSKILQELANAVGNTTVAEQVMQLIKKIRARYYITIVLGWFDGHNANGQRVKFWRERVVNNPYSKNCGIIIEKPYSNKSSGIVGVEKNKITNFFIKELKLFYNIDVNELFITGEFCTYEKGERKCIEVRYIPLDLLVQELKKRRGFCIFDDKAFLKAFELLRAEMTRKGLATYEEGRFVVGFILENKQIRFVAEGEYASKYEDILETSWPEARKKGREAFEALIEISKRCPNEYLRKALWIALAWAVIAALNFVRKCYGLGERNVHLLLYGEPRAGKSAIQKIIGMLFRLDLVGDEFIDADGSSVLESPARLARLCCHFTWPVHIHEANDYELLKSIVSELKNLATGKIAKINADPHSKKVIKFPAYSLVTISTNVKLVINDPGLRDRVYFIEFPESIPKKLHKEFNSFVQRVDEKLHGFVVYYVQFIQKNWQKIEDIVLNGDMLQAGKKLLELMLRDLGFKPEEVIVWDDDEEKEEEEELERKKKVWAKFRELIQKELGEALRRSQDLKIDIVLESNPSIDGTLKTIETLAEAGRLKHFKLSKIKDRTTGKEEPALVPIDIEEIMKECGFSGSIKVFLDLLGFKEGRDKALVERLKKERGSLPSGIYETRVPKLPFSQLRKILLMELDEEEEQIQMSESVQ